jgi:hypothetical protein
MVLSEKTGGGFSSGDPAMLRAVSYYDEKFVSKCLTAGFCAFRNEHANAKGMGCGG